MDNRQSPDPKSSQFYKLRMIHPKSLAGALGVMSFLIYLGVSVLSVLVALFWHTETPISLSMLISLASGAVLVPAFFFMFGLLIAMSYNAYAFLTGGILMEVNAQWNP